MAAQAQTNEPEPTPVPTEVVEPTPVPDDIPEDEFNQDTITDLIERGIGIAPEVVFGIIAIIAGGFLGLALPLGFLLWRSSPQPIKQATYPLADEAMKQYSTRLQQQAHYLQINENPDDDYLIPDMIQRLKGNEVLRKQFADEAAAAGIQVNFIEIVPLGVAVSQTARGVDLSKNQG